MYEHSTSGSGASFQGRRKLNSPQEQPQIYSGYNNPDSVLASKPVFPQTREKENEFLGRSRGNTNR
jgi:hypothetical protein